MTWAAGLDSLASWRTEGCGMGEPEPANLNPTDTEGARTSDIGSETPPLTILTDADTGADDAVSILLGCARANLLAISCTDGNVTAAVATDNTLRLLEAAGFDAGSDLIVAQGLPWPTSEGRHWGKSFDDIFPAASATASPVPAHEVLVAKALEQSVGAATLVCTGPLQNVGAALRHAEQTGQLDAFVSRFAKVVIMGGLCNPNSWAGQLPNNAEFNIRACVDDARALWAAPWPDTVEFVLVPLDPIARTPLLWADVDRVQALAAPEKNCARAAACWAVLDKHVRQDEEMLKSKGLEVYDAFAMALALDPAVALREAHADLTLLPTGQLVCACDDPSMKSHTPPEFVPPGVAEGWSATRRFSILEDIAYERFCELLFTALQGESV